MNAETAASNTAAADRSLMYFISGFVSVERKSIIFSMAVLNSSATQTKPVAKTIAIASPPVILNRKAKTITEIVPAR